MKKKTISRASLEPEGLRDRACAMDLKKRNLKNGIETSVRPNGTPVMPVLRSRSTVKKTVRKKNGLVATQETVRIKGKSQFVLFVSDSNTNRIRWNFFFYLDGGLVSTAPNTGTKGPAPCEVSATSAASGATHAPPRLVFEVASTRPARGARTCSRFAFSPDI